MNLVKSIERGQRDHWLLFRTGYAANTISLLFAVLTACLLTPLVDDDDLGPLIRGLFFVSFTWAGILTWWRSWNRRFSFDVRRVVFGRAREIQKEEERRAWYATVEKWLQANCLGTGVVNEWIWGWDVCRGFDKLSLPVSRRARGERHPQLWIYHDAELERQSKQVSFLDAIEEQPTYYDERPTIGGVTNHLPLIFILTFLLLMLVLGLSPSPRRHASRPAAHDAAANKSKALRPILENRQMPAEFDNVHREPSR